MIDLTHNILTILVNRVNGIFQRPLISFWNPCRLYIEHRSPTTRTLVEQALRYIEVRFCAHAYILRNQIQGGSRLVNMVRLMAGDLGKVRQRDGQV
jgi:hypothetical protein